MMLPASSPYDYYVLRDFREFWHLYGTVGRNVLFVSGLGFDPRCVPGFRVAMDVFASVKLTTFLARFTNLEDEHRARNEEYADRCLDAIRTCRRKLEGRESRHFEVEVTLFSSDAKRPALVGDHRLLKEFRECVDAELDGYTDIIVDVSGFPRTLMYAIVSHLWQRRRPGQNLFAVLTEVENRVSIEESQYSVPRTMRGAYEQRPEGFITWLPVLGGSIDRLGVIHEHLHPDDVVPIVPFPADDPRLGDDLLLKGRHQLFGEWSVPFENVLYASAFTPFDVFRKIHDFVEQHKEFRDDLRIVVSALSGRSLSLGVLLAALWDDLFVCHTQPTTYWIDSVGRTQLQQAIDSAAPRIFWLDGAVYGR